MNIVVMISTPWRESVALRFPICQLLFSNLLATHVKNPAPNNMPNTTSNTLPRINAWSARANTEAEIIIPPAIAEEMPCHLIVILRTKANGNAPRPVARSVSSAAKKT
ncbi:MAG TPA: hypothetical protein VGA95_06285 [Thermodesulfobacteriota bacterium]